MNEIKFGIAMHGFWYPETEKIIEWYLEIEPNSILTLCSYIGSTPISVLEALKDKFKNRFYYILIEEPEVEGLHKRNKQRISAYYSLDLVRKLKIPFAIKCRTDHVFLKPFLEDFYNLLNKYPLPKDIADQKYRLICVDEGTSLSDGYGSYCVSDFWIFGDTGDVIEYFEINHPTWKPENKCHFFETKLKKVRDIHPATYDPFASPAGCFDEYEPYMNKGCVCPESEFCQLWMLYKGIKDKYIDHLQLLADRFIVVNMKDVLFLRYTKKRIIENGRIVGFDRNSLDPGLNDIKNVSYIDIVGKDPLIISHEIWKDCYELLCKGRI